MNRVKDKQLLHKDGVHCAEHLWSADASQVFMVIRLTLQLSLFKGMCPPRPPLSFPTVLCSKCCRRVFYCYIKTTFWYNHTKHSFATQNRVENMCFYGSSWWLWQRQWWWPWWCKHIDSWHSGQKLKRWRAIAVIGILYVIHRWHLPDTDDKKLWKLSSVW